MHIIVCVKQVPDTTDVRIDPNTGTLVREGVPSILNPYDAHACEEAIRLKERYGGEITVISMGPPQAAEALRDCIALGADRAVLLSDRAFAGSDTLATSYALWCGILRAQREWGDADLVLCGKQAIDGDTAQVGPGIARRLDVPQITYALKVVELDLDKRKVVVERRLEKGIETVEAPLPALLTCVEEMNDVRYASLPNLIRSLRYEPIVWTSKDVGADPELCGLKGSPTSVARVFAPPEREPGEIIEGDTVSEKVSRLIEMVLEKLGQTAEAAR
ncbi:MAG: electron transfer flavoprotein subunit beta/FixA family protein [Armatimonadetes bacterium]|nr:electron transfer flavoprotein subunit beta/FixA family protein [Armatimonadota bacterium]